MITVTDDQAEAAYLLGYKNYSEGDYAKAATVFAGLVIARKNEFKYWLGLGAAHQMLKHDHKALNAYDQARRLNQKHPLPYFYSAECLWRQDKPKEALATLLKAEKKASKDKKRFQNFLDQISLLKEVWSKGKLKPIRSD